MNYTAKSHQRNILLCTWRSPLVPLSFVYIVLSPWKWWLLFLYLQNTKIQDKDLPPVCPHLTQIMSQPILCSQLTQIMSQSPLCPQLTQIMSQHFDHFSKYWHNKTIHWSYIITANIFSTKLTTVLTNIDYSVTMEMTDQCILKVTCNFRQENFYLHTYYYITMATTNC